MNKRKRIVDGYLELSTSSANAPKRNSCVVLLVKDNAENQIKGN